MALERFHFTAADGTEFDVHYAYDKLRRKDLRRIQDEFEDDPAGQEEAMLEACLDKKDIEKLDELSMRDYLKFIKGWMQQDEEGPAVGE